MALTQPLDPPAPSHSTAAVARRLGVSIPTVQRWVDLGHLKAWKTVGGHRRIDAASLEAFMQQQDRPQPAPMPSDEAPAGVLVLIVDDNPDDRDLLGALVEEALPGAAVAVAENGFEGLLSMGRRTPDVLVTDIMMPNMSGIEMLRHVALLPRGRPRLIVAVSSSTPQQIAAFGLMPEHVHFIGKPLEPDVFISTLGKAAVAAGLRPA
jgi:excisionase family DNA binding protein